MLSYTKEIADGAMIHCPKEEDARLLRRYLEAHGCKEETACNSTSEITDDMAYEIHRDHFYQFDFKHPQLVVNCSYGYPVIEFSDLVLPEETEPSGEQELSAKGLLEWFRHFYEADDYDDAFPNMPRVYGISDLFDKYTSEEIIRIITAYEAKRKANTDKLTEVKQAEPEWVSICEIINTESEGIADNWRCEYREAVSSDPSVQKKQAEEILEKYRSEHKGKYITWISQICRMKKG